MADWQIAMVMMIGYLVIALVVGVLAGRGRDHSSVEEFAVAGGKLGMVVMWFLMGGAVFSAFSFLGAPGWAYAKGAPAFYIITYTAFAILPWYIIGPKISRIGKKFNLYTLAGFLKNRYNSRALAIIIGLLSVLAFVQYLATQLKGMAYIFSIMTEGRIPFWLGALLAYGIVVLYVATGGLRAAAWSDVLQGALMIIISWVIGFVVVFQLHGGPTNMFTSIIESKPGFLEIGLQGSNMSPMSYSTTILVSVLGFLMWPHLFSKSYASTPKVIKKTVLVYPIFALFLVPLLFIGFAAVTTISPDQVGSPDEILPYIVTSMLSMPGWVYGLVGAGALAAAMSSADAITHSASLEFTDGFIKNIWTDLSDKTVLMIMRIGIFVIGGVAYYITIFGGQGLIALLLGAYGSIVQFVPAVYGALYWKRVSTSGIIAGILVGTVINYYYQLVAESTPLGIHAGILGLIANIIIVVIASYLSKSQSVNAAKDYIEA
jgi:SSS family solute:Na+ symporter